MSELHPTAPLSTVPGIGLLQDVTDELRTELEGAFRGEPAPEIPAVPAAGEPEASSAAPEATQEGEEELGTSVPGDPPAPATSTAAPSAPEAPPLDFVEWRGQRIASQAMDGLVNLAAFVAANPQRAQEFAHYLQTGQLPGGATPQPAASAGAPQPAAPAEDLSIYPPEIRSRLERVDALAAADAARRQADEQTRFQTTVRDIDSGARRFAADRELSDGDLNAIQAQAVRLGVFKGLVDQGMAVHEAAYQAMDVAYSSLPQFRQRDIDRALEVAAKDELRQRKLASVGGTAGSVARTREKPRNRSEAEGAFLQDMAQAMNDGSFRE